MTYQSTTAAAQIMDRPVEGYGGIIGDPVTSISAANIERIAEGVHQTRYPNESMLAHDSATRSICWRTSIRRPYCPTPGTPTRSTTTTADIWTS